MQLYGCLLCAELYVSLGINSLLTFGHAYHRASRRLLHTNTIECGNVKQMTNYRRENGFRRRVRGAVWRVCSYRTIFQFFSCNQLADQFGWSFVAFLAKTKNIISSFFLNENSKIPNHLVFYLVIYLSQSFFLFLFKPNF